MEGSVFRSASRGVGQISVLCIGFLLSACASAPYEPGSLSSVSLRERAQVQSGPQITVSAAVPGPEETEAIFNLPLYDKGIQPVWLEVKNETESMIRYAPVGTDPEYFSGQELAYVHRGGYSKEGLEALNQYFYDMVMPRRIPSGETRSGFVFTHAHPGTKGFNVDLFGAASDSDLSFTFFIDVPGFEPDHSGAFLESLYQSDQIQDLGEDELRTALVDRFRVELARNSGVPVNGVVVGQAQEVLQALIRAGWQEQRRSDAELEGEISTFDGRIADVLFVKHERLGGERNELRFWMSPYRAAGVPVWMVQSAHNIGVGGGLLDPDLDDAALFFLQDVWYGQGLERFGWLKVQGSSSLDELARTSSGAEYFTSGSVFVGWLSGHQISMLEVDLLGWDPSPSGGVE